MLDQPSGLTSARVNIFDPTGAKLLGTNGLPAIVPPFIEPVSLTTSGTYTLFIDPADAEVGSVRVRVWTVTDLVGPITPGGTAVASVIAIPGQNASYTFTGTVGQRVSVTAIGSLSGTYGGFSQTEFNLSGPGGTVASILLSQSPNSIIDTVTLTAAGTYTLVLDPVSDLTGTVNLQVYNVTDLTGNLTVGATPTVVPFTTPGQNATYTFSGNSGDNLRVTQSASTLNGGGNLTVEHPTGTGLTGSGLGLPACVNIPTLTSTDEGSVILNPTALTTGNLSIGIEVQAGQCPFERTRPAATATPKKAPYRGAPPKKPEHQVRARARRHAQRIGRLRAWALPAGKVA